MTCYVLPTLITNWLYHEIIKISINQLCFGQSCHNLHFLIFFWHTKKQLYFPAKNRVHTHDANLKCSRIGPPTLQLFEIPTEKPTTPHPQKNQQQTRTAQLPPHHTQRQVKLNRHPHPSTIVGKANFHSQPTFLHLSQIFTRRSSNWGKKKNPHLLQQVSFLPK
jgi:hypothetical protein